MGGQEFLSLQGTPQVTFFFFLLPLDPSSNTNGSLGTFGRLKEYAFCQGSIMVLLCLCVKGDGMTREGREDSLPGTQLAL